MNRTQLVELLESISNSFRLCTRSIEHKVYRLEGIQSTNAEMKKSTLEGLNEALRLSTETECLFRTLLKKLSQGTPGAHTDQVK